MIRLFRLSAVEDPFVESLLLNADLNGFQKDLYIQFNAPVIAVFLIIFHFFHKGNTVSPLDLRQPGKPRPKPVNPVFQAQTVCPDLAGDEGPTKLISPFRIFQSCGSSSRLVLRSTLPSFVIYCSGFSSSPVAQLGVLFFIV